MPKQVIGPNGEIWVEAPDDSWILRTEQYPVVNEVVEVCWVSRKKEPATYHISRAKVTILPRHENEGGTWYLENGDTAYFGDELVFNPDFWRPLQA